MIQPPQASDQDVGLERRKQLARFNESSNAGEMLKLAALQLASALLLSAGVFAFYGMGDALSAFLGGLIAALMSVFLATRMFTTHRLASIREMTANERLGRFYASALLKVLLTLLMMGILIAVIKVSMLPFIIGYLIAAVAVNLVFLLISKD